MTKGGLVRNKRGMTVSRGVTARARRNWANSGLEELEGPEAATPTCCCLPGMFTMQDGTHGFCYWGEDHSEFLEVQGWTQPSSGLEASADEPEARCICLIRRETMLQQMISCSTHGGEAGGTFQGQRTQQYSGTGILKYVKVPSNSSELQEGSNDISPSQGEDDQQSKGSSSRSWGSGGDRTRSQDRTSMGTPTVRPREGRMS